MSRREGLVSRPDLFDYRKVADRRDNAKSIDEMRENRTCEYAANGSVQQMALCASDDAECYDP